MALLFFKATIKGGAGADLFAQPVRIEGHTREGHFVRPHYARRLVKLHAAEPTPKPPVSAEPDLFDRITQNPAEESPITQVATPEPESVDVPPKPQQSEYERQTAEFGRLRLANAKMLATWLGTLPESTLQSPSAFMAKFNHSPMAAHFRIERTDQNEPVLRDREGDAGGRWFSPKGMTEYADLLRMIIHYAGGDGSKHWADQSRDAEAKALASSKAGTSLIDLLRESGFAVIAPDKQPNPKAAAKLRAAGQEIIASANEAMGRDRQANTRKRVQQAASAIQDAQRESQIGQTMINLADVIETGEAKALSSITTRAAVEQLDEELKNSRVTRWRTMQARSPTEGHANWEQMMSRPIEPDDVRHAKLPVPLLYGHSARNILEVVDAIGIKPGHEKTIEWLRSIGPDDGKRPDEQALRAILPDLDHAIRQHTDNYKSHYTQRNAANNGRYAIRGIKELLQKQSRFSRMGINSDLDLQRALAEYMLYRGGRPKEDPLKKLERDLVGTKPGIDFFPTPPPLAQHMVQLAGIKPGMRVLEPSAGKGDIADAIAAAGGKVEALEIAGSLKAVLGAKGHNLVGTDFEDFTPAEKYDAIVMNPPWSGGADVRHVMRAWDMVKPGGRLVALMSLHASFAQDKASTAFRAFLENTGATQEKHGAEAFKSQWMSQGIPSWLIAIDKPMAKAIDGIRTWPPDLAAIVLLEERTPSHDPFFKSLVLLERIDDFEVAHGRPEHIPASLASIWPERKQPGRSATPLQGSPEHGVLVLSQSGDP
jgi:protein-L-isoaspartate O-methyltransferase